MKKLILRDNGVVKPGILVRQLFLEADLGRPKIHALTDRLKLIRPDVEIASSGSNLVSGLLESDDWSDGADVVIESTGSNTLLSKFEATRHRKDKRVPIISMCLGHKADRAMMLVARENFSGGLLDVDRKLRQVAYRQPALSEFVDEFWPDKPRSEIFQPEPGCSDATFVGSCADVAALTATMLNLAAGEIMRSSTIASAYLIDQSLCSGKGPKRFEWPADRIMPDPESNYEVRVSASAWNEITAWISANDRERNPMVETGGLLFGQRNNLLKILWIDEVSGPPPDSTRSETGFVCGIQGNADLAKEKEQRTHDLVRFLGMWHTHPNGVPIPSTTDLAAVEQLQSSLPTSSKTPLMMIVGGGKGRYTVAAYAFGPDTIKRLREGSEYKAAINLKSDPAPVRNVGIALSGGGSRAIAFHLGCLRALNDRGLLIRAHVISSVSGGAVIAAMYAYSGGSFAEFDASVVKLLEKGLQSSIAKQLMRPGTAVSTLGSVAMATTAALIADVVRSVSNAGSAFLALRSKRVRELLKLIQPPLRRWNGTTHAFQKALQNESFGSMHLTDARRQNMDIVFNATELRSGSAFRFGSRESGCWRYGSVDSASISVAHAVAASAAYPALLPAIDEVLNFTDRRGNKQSRRVLLTDGGVYDNLGVTCLEPNSGAGFGYCHSSPDYIICCDAGQGIFQDHSVPFLWGPRMIRAFESVFRKAQNATQNRLHLLTESGQIKGFVLAYLGQIDRRLPSAPSDLVPRLDVQEYPTDFAAMRSEDIATISKRGEQITRALIAYYCPEL